MRLFVVCIQRQDQNYGFDDSNFVDKGRFDLKKRFGRTIYARIISKQRYKHATHV